MHTRWVVVAAGLMSVGLSWTATAEQMSVPPLGTHLPSLEHSQFPSSVSLLERLARTYTSPEAIAKFLHRDFTFTRDTEAFGQADHWQTPEEFAARRVGDCEDYAVLARELLRRNGIEADVFSLFGQGGYAHTVCLFKDARGRYNVLDQDTLRAYHATSLEDVASALHPAWIFGGITEPQGARGRLVRRLTNTHPATALDFSSPLANFQF